MDVMGLVMIHTATFRPPGAFGYGSATDSPAVLTEALGMELRSPITTSVAPI